MRGVHCLSCSVSKAKRRSGEIAQVVEAYTAGLGYRPQAQHHPNVDVATEGDVASDGVGIDGRGSGVGDASKAVRRKQPIAPDWCLDGGAGNRWAMGLVARRALHYSLQAGAVAHLPLKERLEAEVPWVKVRRKTGRRVWGWELIQLGL